MGMTQQIMFGQVMHGRLFPKRNNFTYGIYYIALPLNQMNTLPIAHNRFAPISFYDRDHGNRDGTNLEKWARQVLDDHDMTDIDGTITLVCMPRIFGYVFNPVSFWLCHDKNQNLRAILCEVHNTFSENHTYVCAHADHAVISKDKPLQSQKIFHVSPFLKREGHYEFKFDIKNDDFKVWIDFFNADQKKQLVTTLIGSMRLMNKRNLRKAFWGYPLVTLKAITLIHWQAIKLVVKGIKYIPKPLQNHKKVSTTNNLNKL